MRFRRRGAWQLRRDRLRLRRDRQSGSIHVCGRPCDRLQVVVNTRKIDGEPKFHELEPRRGLASSNRCTSPCGLIRRTSAANPQRRLTQSREEREGHNSSFRSLRLCVRPLCTRCVRGPSTVGAGGRTFVTQKRLSPAEILVSGRRSRETAPARRSGWLRLSRRARSAPPRQSPRSSSPPGGSGPRHTLGEAGSGIAGRP